MSNMQFCELITFKIVLEVIGVDKKAQWIQAGHLSSLPEPTVGHRHMYAQVPLSSPPPSLRHPLSPRQW